LQSEAALPQSEEVIRPKKALKVTLHVWLFLSEPNVEKTIRNHTFVKENMMLD
jgi:hypothetical protein